MRAKKWRLQCQAVKYSEMTFELTDKSLRDNILRFNPIQIAEWLSDLLGFGTAHSQAELEDKLGVDRRGLDSFCV